MPPTPIQAAACANNIDRERDALSRTIAAFASARVIEADLRLEGDSVAANWYAGGPHCATLSQPAR
jgi:hypothetical protein